MPVGQEKIGFLQWRVTGHIGYSLGQGPCPGLLSQHKTDSCFIVCVSVLFGLGFFFFCLTDFLLFSQVLFVFDRRRERGRERTKLSGEGGGEEI